MRYYLSVVVFSALVFLQTAPLLADVVFIVNPSTTIDSADSDMIKDIFLGHMIKWPDGKDVKFVLLNDPEIHKEFVRTYLKRNPTQFKNYWKKMLFSGKGEIPKTLSQADVIKYVAENEGAIGYVGKGADLSTVKILNVAQ